MINFLKNNYFKLSFLLLLVLYIFPIWVVEYLPMHDFPQHMAQVSVLKNHNNPLFGFQGKYTFDWFTPYLSGVILTWFFSNGVGLLNGSRIVISLTVLLFPLSMYVLLRKLKGDTWWCLIGFPMAYGFNFAQGHYNFWVGIPFGLFFISYAISTAEGFFKERLFLLLVFSALLFFSHAILFVATIVFVSAFIVGKQFQERKYLLLLALLVFGVLFPRLWWVKFGYKFQIPIEWNLKFNSRFLELPSYFLGPMNDLLSSVFLLLLVVLMFIGSKISKIRVSFYPLLISLGLYFFTPYRFYAHSIYQRLSFFLIPALFPLLKPMPTSSRVRFGRFSFFILVLAWGLIVGNRFLRFNKEAQEFNPILARMEFNKKVLPILFKLDSKVISSTPYAHFVSWYQVYKGGEVGFSFSMQPPQLARLNGREWPSDIMYIRSLRRYPSELNWSKVKSYDYFVVRSEKDQKDFLFKQAPTMVSLHAQSGEWWLYKNNSNLNEI